MNRFIALDFYLTGNSLGLMISMASAISRDGRWPADTARVLKEAAQKASSVCERIELRLSAKAFDRFASEISEDWSGDTLKARVDALKHSIQDELENHLFLWVPSHRAAFFSTSADAMVGGQCCARFKSIQRELEEAAKCYALGRYTSCAFHLMRSTEAGVKALARAINYTPPHNQWELVFKQMKAEFALKPSLRPAHWQTHGDFLETVWADLRAVSKAWRNDIAHLVDTYSEEEAQNLLTVIPMFLRDLATQMNEKGKLFTKRAQHAP